MLKPFDVDETKETDYHGGSADGSGDQELDSTMDTRSGGYDCTGSGRADFETPYNEFGLIEMGFCIDFTEDMDHHTGLDESDWLNKHNRLMDPH